MLPLSNRKFSFDCPPGASMYYSLFKHQGCLKGGMPVNRIEGNDVRVRSLPLDACVKDVAETNINIASFVKFPMTDVYGCVSMRVNDVNRHMCTKRRVFAPDLTFIDVDKDYIDCKRTDETLVGNEIRLDVRVLNPQDLAPGMHIKVLTCLWNIAR